MTTTRRKKPIAEAGAMPDAGSVASSSRADDRDARRAARIRRRTSQRWLAGYPDLVAQWHPTKNGDLFPDQVSFGSQRRLWWKCSEGPDHEWRAVVGSRTLGAGCPFCAGQRVSVTNSLATRAPALASEWHPSKNGDLLPSDVVGNARAKVWWRCPLDQAHEWRASPNSRAGGRTGCPFCSNVRLAESNSVAAFAPAVAAEWHPTKNRSLTARDVVWGSAGKVWWKCPVGRDHQWEASPNDRISHDRGCPFCAGKRAARSNSLAALDPRVSAEWHRTRNGDLRPRDVTVGSHRKCWWRCRDNPTHEWQAMVQNRTKNRSGCPLCAGRKRK